MPALERDFKFRDQLHDAAESAPRLVAEGFGRWSHRDFARYLVMARSKVMEVQSDLLALGRRGILASDLLADVLELADKTIRTINRLRSTL